MSVATTGLPSKTGSLGGKSVRRMLRALLPAFSLALVVIAIAWLNPRAISYFGFTLMLNLAVPIALATIAQSSPSAATTSTFRSVHSWGSSAA